MDVALLRNSASRLGVKEITQRGQNILFYLNNNSSVNGIMNLTKKYKGRILVNGSDNGYISVKLAPKEQPVALMKEVVREMGS